VCVRMIEHYILVFQRAGFTCDDCRIILLLLLTTISQWCYGLSWGRKLQIYDKQLNGGDNGWSKFKFCCQIPLKWGIFSPKFDILGRNFFGLAKICRAG